MMNYKFKAEGVNPNLIRDQKAWVEIFRKQTDMTPHQAAERILGDLWGYDRGSNFSTDVESLAHALVVFAELSEPKIEEAKPKKTFEDFVASKVRMENVNPLMGLSDEDVGAASPGWVYFPYKDEKGEVVGGFHITIGYESAATIYYLCIGNQEWEDQDLSKLERILWDEFADGETNG